MNISQKKHHLCRASMSVEAVFIIPLVLFILFFLLFFSFFTHQKIWFTEAAYEAALSPEKEEEKAHLLLEEVPLAAGVPDVDVQKSKHQITVTYHGTVMSAGKLKLNYRSSARTQVLNPVDIIRKIRLVKKLK